MRPPFHSLPSASLAKAQILSKRPPICSIQSLLSPDESQRLIAKAEHIALIPQSFDNSEAAGERTSCGCVVRNEEVPTLRSRFADFAGVELSQLQPLKVTRYLPGQRFDVHTDAWRGDSRGAPTNADDYWGDRMRLKYGVVGAPISGCNRIMTIFVYLNDVARGGRTRWRWTEHDAATGGTLHRLFYDKPGPGSGRTDLVNGSGPSIAVAPEAGLGVVHFPSVAPHFGGYTDYNAFHEAEPPGDGCIKYVAQQFIWSHPRLDWKRVLDEENWEPDERRTEDAI